MSYITGRSASPGMASGNAFIYIEQDLSFETVSTSDPDKEILRLKDAFGNSKLELEDIKNSLSGDLGEEFGHIFRAQMTMIEDEEFYQEITDIIAEEKICAEAGLKTIFTGYSDLFSSLGEDDYNRQRLLDLTDVYKRILRNLLGLQAGDLSGVPENSIIVAEDLMPSDTALMNKENIAGMITEKGGVTSHVAILAKSLGIPAAVGVTEAIGKTSPKSEILLDSRDFETAKIWFSADKEEKEIFLIEKKKHEDRLQRLDSVKDLEAVTIDGRKIDLSANIGSIEDLNSARSFGAKSVGLLRTEFFFLDTVSLPDENKQFEFYKTIAESLNPGMVVIRTLDIGGDKEVKCFDLPDEDNPFLGLRGIRVCLKYREIFKTQLRAVLRAAAYGNIKMMFPMVADLTEFRAAKTLIVECCAELESEKLDYNGDIEIGVMVETPAAVMISDILTEECDFISIGTNDLTQYVLCADRINENVSDYYRIFSPAIFRSLKTAVDNAHANNRWAGICGELGGIPIVLPILIGLGIDELSMTGQMLPEAVSIIRSLKYEDCKKAAEKLLKLKTEEEIKVFLQENFTQE
ncbi:MAG: phosphoenolpyruvate--protein phosphotransferase [Spirochaetales bacterium]|uniref:Phosphoenolpyruvate-protein phosphotransferase n=1 Tax=Candidatus Thalassospirochaeta sargassi TaxID=3119039 RepID=A0AAJ1IHQ3_9SPIO|nr:phosphoenolpyruvate--protein phosphotransferase [Spirochaetales bacterium]